MDQYDDRGMDQYEELEFNQIQSVNDQAINAMQEDEQMSNVEYHRKKKREKCQLFDPATDLTAIVELLADQNVTEKNYAVPPEAERSDMLNDNKTFFHAELDNKGRYFHNKADY